MAGDFLTVEVWTAKGLKRFVVLFFIELSGARGDRRYLSRGERIVAEPDCSQVDRLREGLLTGKRYLIHDRDLLFTDEFLRTLKDANVESVTYPREVRT